MESGNYTGRLQLTVGSIVESILLGECQDWVCKTCCCSVSFECGGKSCSVILIFETILFKNNCVYYLIVSIGGS